MSEIIEDSASENEQNYDNPMWFQSLNDLQLPSAPPVDINLSKAAEIEMPKLEWYHFDVTPKKTRITNSGLTLIVTAKWHNERPFICGGPLLDNYVFSLIHFHWGVDDSVGSEHMVDHFQAPMEMHAVFYKKSYNTHQSALKEKDGIVMLTYLYKLQSGENQAIQHLLNSILTIQKPLISERIVPIPLSCYVRPFEYDYYIYWGSISTSVSEHCVLWMISRVPIGISMEQVDTFRSLLDINEEEMATTVRILEPNEYANVFHVCPSGRKYASLLPLP